MSMRLCVSSCKVAIACTCKCMQMQLNEHKSVLAFAIHVGDSSIQILHICDNNRQPPLTLWQPYVYEATLLLSMVAGKYSML